MMYALIFVIDGRVNKCLMGTHQQCRDKAVELANQNNLIYGDIDYWYNNADMTTHVSIEPLQRIV